MDQYALDDPGRSAADVYAERARKVTKQPTGLVWQQEPELVDYDEGITRGDGYTDPITCLIFPAMRLGFFLQLGSLALMLFMHLGQGGGVWTFDLFNVGETMRNSATFTFAMCCLLFGYGLGTAGLLLFQCFITDNGKYSRGFRAGSKLFQSALLLDLLVLCIRFIAFVYSHHFLNDRWWTHLNQTRADFSLFHFGHLIHGIALMLYGLGMFYMEVYHDEGTYEEFGWSLLSLFGLAGFLEILMVFTNFGAFFGYVQLLALTGAVIWAMSFEPLLHYHASALHDRTVNDSLLVNNYAPINDEANADAYEFARAPGTRPGAKLASNTSAFAAAAGPPAGNSFYL
ncbi:putative transmembrane protein [Gregarina niphandrodes]|uniref:Transmembrane protein n=1 Tax=Gregarina niphandrodes TaxID=110365 RepID=A0A023BDY2_GRENI|nr:putative transmembrane protein [Gregarina niphandrodes]EZG88837.1 putative transmembrane protein [Gregarina niphandrodes]|eukprot:XP_011128536.1 putative transmembrane protein [Gregarina niphandrodes]